MAVITRKPLKVAINPYPTRYRLPGDGTPARQHLPEIQGAVRKNIVHALTFHEIPPDVDAKIDKLPSEAGFAELDPIKHHYLSLTVYSLKQMVAAGTVSAESAWNLFYGEWGRITDVTVENFRVMKETFMQDIRERIGEDGLPKGLSLLEFEFYARAGEAGLAQYEKYHEWAQKLDFGFSEKVFDSVKMAEDKIEILEKEYQKALWLEMRLIEGRIGINSLNEDIQKCILTAPGSGHYDELQKEVGAAIDLTENKPIDAVIKSEVGHWMFVTHRQGWVAELMDEMNLVGYTSRIDDCIKCGHVKNLPPEARAFMEGGYGYDKSLRWHSPAYPLDMLSMRQLREVVKHLAPNAVHLIAECVDILIRIRLVRAYEEREIGQNEVYRTYRKVGVYIALLDLEERNMEEILQSIERFKLDEINDYYHSYRERATQALK